MQRLHSVLPVALVALLGASPAAADDKLPAQDARVELPDLVAKLGTLAGKVINIPGALDTKPSALYTCGHDKKKWVAFELLDRGKSLVAYCPIGKVANCGDFAKDKLHIQYALVKVPACKQAVVELLDY